MAIVDPCRIQNEDRLSFLEAVRAATIGSDNGITPSRKMYETIFDILKDSPSLQLIMSSYQLLLELDKKFPKVNLSNTGKSVVAKEPWSPFSLGQKHSTYGKETSQSGDPLDSLGFYQLVENIAQDFTEAKSLKHVGDMLMFQYLVYVLEKDFRSRNTVYKETNGWNLLGESILNMLLVCRGINYTGLMKNCISILCKDNSQNTVVASDFALNTSYFEWKQMTCMAVEKFLSLVIELDNTKQADPKVQITAVDRLRTPLIEIIRDELSYNKQILSRLLQVFSDPKGKIEIILQYISSYSKKASTCTQRSSISSGNTSLDDVLSYFSSETSTGNILSKISTNEVQLLLAHSFQAYFKLHGKNEDKTGIVQVCKDVIAAFKNLKNICKNMEMIPIGKEALFTAVAIVTMKSSRCSKIEVSRS
ncbi:isoform X1 [Ranunculus cassubicifolius]